MRRRLWNTLPTGIQNWLLGHFPFLSKFPLPIELIVLQKGDRNPIDPQVLRQGACLGILIGNAPWTLETKDFSKTIPALTPFLLLPSGWSLQQFRELEKKCKEFPGNGEKPGES